MVRKFLGIKKKASRKLKRKEGLTTKQIRKLMEKIYRAETAIKYSTKRSKKPKSKKLGKRCKIIQNYFSHMPRKYPAIRAQWDRLWMRKII